MADFAIIQTGGKQYRVSVGDIIKVEKLDDTKKNIELTDLLAGNKVSAEIIGSGKADKIRIVKHHPKKRYKRVNGHRQQYCEIKINKISKNA